LDPTDVEIIAVSRLVDCIPTRRLYPGPDKKSTEIDYSILEIHAFSSREFGLWNDAGSKMLDARSWILNPGSWIMEAGSRILNPGSSMMHPGSCLRSWNLEPGYRFKAFRFRIQDPESRILHPGSWIQDIQVPASADSCILDPGHGCCQVSESMVQLLDPGSCQHLGLRILDLASCAWVTT
jgi:hypothetical protein